MTVGQSSELVLRSRATGDYLIGDHSLIKATLDNANLVTNTSTYVIPQNCN